MGTLGAQHRLFLWREHPFELSRQQPLLSLVESVSVILWVQGRHKSTTGNPGTVGATHLCQFWYGRLFSLSFLLDLTEKSSCLPPAESSEHLWMVLLFPGTWAAQQDPSPELWWTSAGHGGVLSIPLPAILSPTSGEGWCPSWLPADLVLTHEAPWPSFHARICAASRLMLTLEGVQRCLAELPFGQ